MKYDDASWHAGGEFPADLPPSAGAIHIGMFVAWCLLNGMAGELHTDEFPDDLVRLRHREFTPGAWFLRTCDGKFIDEDVDHVGNAFALDYYHANPSKYFADYETTVCGGLPSLYHVPDTWQTYDALEPVIRARFEEWRRTSR